LWQDENDEAEVLAEKKRGTQVVRKAVDNSTLARWRNLEALAVIKAVADYAKEDAYFTPKTSKHSTRWHVNTGGTDYEILCTGPKFLDTRARRGGGGAIDLVMYVFQLSFTQAVALLREKNL
jgi:hypothetical protein